MRSVKLGLVLATAFSVGFGLVGCSSDASNDDVGDPDASADSSVTEGGNGAVKDASVVDSGAAHDAGHDVTNGGGNDDAAVVDAAKDADAQSPVDAAADVPVADAQADVATGPVDAGPPGSPCAPLNAIQTQVCGMCGSQQRVCLAGGDGGAVWQSWGACLNEAVNGCVPGTTDNEACGLCGHRTKICQLDCVYAVGSCQGQPANACEPGTTNFIEGLSCDAGAGRSQTCDSTCAWGGFGTCGKPDYGPPVSIATTAAGTVTSVRTLLASPTLPVLGYGQCPASIRTAGSKNAYAYVLVSNGTAKTAKVSVWFSKATGGQDIDTMIAAYPGNTAIPPLTDAARIACLNVGPSANSQDVNDYCESNNTVAGECTSGWGGLVADDANDNSITIAPHGSIWIYAGAVENVASTSPHAGAFQINVRTESLN